MSRRRRLIERGQNSTLSATAPILVVQNQNSPYSAPTGGGATGGYNATTNAYGGTFNAYDVASGNAYDATQANEAYDTGRNRTHGQESRWVDNR